MLTSMLMNFAAIYLFILTQVDSRTRYMSVSSRKVDEEEDTNQTDERCHKKSTTELPPDRVTYYEQLQRLVKVGSQDITFNQRQVRCCY